MRNKIVATLVALFMTTGFVGCKMAPKMPWSKTAATSDVTSNVESTTLAHSAPSLPADVAKQAESLASASPSIKMSAPSIQTSGGMAAPYSAAPALSATTPTIAATTPGVTNLTPGSGAKAAPSAYPSTGASPYSTTAPPTVVATASPVMPAMSSNDRSANLGSVDMPYNPKAVPPARTVASAAPVTPTTGPDRYGMSSVANTPSAYGGASVPTLKTASVPQISGGDRYGNVQTSAPHPMTQTPPASIPPASIRSDRYASSHTVTPTLRSITPQSPVSTAPLVTSAPFVASAPTYRPGGTTSYAGMLTGQPTIEIASRPKPVDPPQVPNVSAPGSASEPSEAPRYR